MLNVLTIAWDTLRVLLCAAAAAALLFALSYPDSVIPPDPAKEGLGAFTVYGLRGYVWVLPLGLTLLISALGRRFFLIWFTAMLVVGISAFIAWPVLQATYPEWVQPSLPFQGGMLPAGLGLFALILAAGFLVYLLVRFLFPAPEKEDVGTAEASVLDALQARTVQEIAANPLHPQPKFLFGDADLTLVERFGLLWRGLRRRRLGRVSLLLLALGALAGWFFLYPQPTEQEALQRDVQRMQEHHRGLGTRAAAHAALRVMEHISDHESLAGMTREEAETRLGLDKVDPAYRAVLRDSSDVSIPSVDNAFESRERFLTVRDPFGHWAVLYIRTDAEGKHINVSEVQDAGWNAVYDEQRRRMGTGWRRSFFN